MKESFPTNLFFDEGGLYYIWKGIREGGRQIRSKEIIVIHSSFRPIADHIIAWWLKGRFPHIRWIADYRDVHVDENRSNTFFPAWQHRIERYLLRRADVLSTVSVGLADFLGMYDRPVFILRNGIPMERLFDKDPELRVDKFTINYTGTIYPDKQDAATLLSALQLLIKSKRVHPASIAIRCVGKDYNYWQNKLIESDLLHCGQLLLPVGLESSLAYQRQAHINLLLSWSGPAFSGVLTGKLYEYLSARRPILALINGPEDIELTSMISNYNQGRAWSTENLEIEELASWIEEMYQAWSKDIHHPVFHFSGSLLDVSWDVQMDHFLEELPFDIPVGYLQEDANLVGCHEAD
ncbi:MAG: hypothetical protein R2787_08750 [Saprospiraceae bacterium]